MPNIGTGTDTGTNSKTSENDASDAGAEAADRNAEGRDSNGIGESTGGGGSSEEPSISRRPFVKGAVSGALALSVAGCTGEGNEGNGGNNSTSNGSGIEGTSFTFWDVKYFGESRDAEKAITDAISSFNEKTGANAQLNKQTGEQPILESFKSGNQPAAFTQSIYNLGKFISSDQLYSFSDYRNQHQQYVENLVDGVDTYLDFCYSGWEEDKYAVPMTSCPYAPFMARADHFEEAGLDIEKDFPPENFEDLVEVATALEENGPGTGYQTYGSTADMHDVFFNQWTSAEGGKKGWGFTDDWSDVRFDNDVWKKCTRWVNELYNEHGFGTPQTPTMTDEDTINLLVQGKVSMANQASFNQPVFMDRAGDMIEDGTLVWGEPWGGKTGNQSYNWTAGVAFAKPPEGKDEAAWEKKQKAAHQLVNYLSTSGFMSETMPNLGFMPSRADTVEKIDVENSDNLTQNWYDVTSSIQSGSKYAYECHPLRVEVYAETFAAEGQKMLKGEQSAEEACNNAAEKARELNKETQFA